MTVHAEPREWSRAIDRTGLTWLLHITGGEPTIYPRFAELCRLLTAKHFISFNSNLTHPSALDIAKHVDPSRISYINAGFHPEERELKKGLPTFLKHAYSLIARNFPLFISVVATPDVLSRFDEIIGLTATLGIAPLPKLLRGPYKGKHYPAAYSAEEKMAFREFAAKACKTYNGPFLQGLTERPSIDVFGDEKYLDGVAPFRGRMCIAGERFVSLRPNGNVYRCQPKQTNYLGNLLDCSFRRLNGKSPCDSYYCFYFCLKFADAASGAANESDTFAFSHREPDETRWRNRPMSAAASMSDVEQDAKGAA